MYLESAYLASVSIIGPSDSINGLKNKSKKGAGAVSHW